LHGGVRQTIVEGMMKNILLSGVSVAVLASCGVGDRLTSKPATPEVQIVAPLEPTVRLPPPPGAKTAAALDTTTEAERSAALAAPVAGARSLGTTTVALGSPAEAGFWLRSSLVSAPGKGKVVTAGGASVAVDLRPGSGGALLSLAAYRALGLALTDLPQVTVFAD